jgi:hypothetical protein
MDDSQKKKKNAGSFKQLKLLLWKNYILQRRSILGTILELAVPALFAIILLPIRNIVDSDRILVSTVYDSFSVDRLPPDLLPKSAIDKLKHDNDLNSNFSRQYTVEAGENWCFGYWPNNSKLLENVMKRVGDEHGFTINCNLNFNLFINLLFLYY